MELTERHVLVTGASRGIGRALVTEFVARGARVTAVARDSRLLDELGDQVGSASLPRDLTDHAQLDTVIADAEALGGPVDVLVNNAGLMVVGPVADETAQRVRDVVDLNIAAPFELCRQALPGMLDRDRGRIVNVSSLGGVTALAEIATYGASKAALSLFTAALSRELRATNVRATVVQLGEVAGTELMESVRESPRIAAMSDRLTKLRAFVALTPEVVARDIVDATVQGRPYLVSPGRSTPLHLIRELPSRVSDALFYRLPTDAAYGTGGKGRA